jgi:hypothetical protein
VGVDHERDLADDGLEPVDLLLEDAGTGGVQAVPLLAGLSALLGGLGEQVVGDAEIVRLG